MEPELVVESSKAEQLMEGISHATQPTRASIKSSFDVATTTEVTKESKESSNFELDDVYVAPIEDPMSNSDDEFDEE